MVIIDDHSIISEPISVDTCYACLCNAIDHDLTLEDTAAHNVKTQHAHYFHRES